MSCQDSGRCENRASAASIDGDSAGAGGNPAKPAPERLQNSAAWMIIIIMIIIIRLIISIMVIIIISNHTNNN